MNTKKKKVTAAVAVSSLAAAMIAGGIMAYFTDGDTVTNTFTVGKVSMDLKEPNFDEDEAEDLVPNQEYEKDPQTTNTGINSMYTFMEVEVPFANVVRVNADGTVEHATETELFSYSINAPAAGAAGWVELTYLNGVTRDGTFYGLEDNIEGNTKTISNVAYATQNVETSEAVTGGNELAKTAYGNGHTITDANGNIISTQAAKQGEDSSPAVINVQAQVDNAGTKTVTPVVDGNGNDLISGYFDYNVYYTIDGVNLDYLTAHDESTTNVRTVSVAKPAVDGTTSSAQDSEAAAAYDGLVKFSSLSAAQAYCIYHNIDTDDITAHGRYVVNGVIFDTAAAAAAYSAECEAVYGVGSPESKILQVGTVRHLYAYVDEAAAEADESPLHKVEAGETTTPLFNSVKLINMTEDAGLEKASLDLTINGYSIQSDFLGEEVATDDFNGDRPVINEDGAVEAGEVWAILSNQANSTVGDGQYIFRRDIEDEEGSSTDIIDADY